MKDNIVMTIGTVFAVSFLLGMIVGGSLSFSEGFKAGFDKALPLTYATMNK